MPVAHGGKNWPPAAYSPRTRMMYIPANNNMCQTLVGVEVKYVPGRGFTGTGMTKGPGTTLKEGAKHVGEVQAWNVDTGQLAWTHTYRQANWGPILTTGGNLLFAGGTPIRCSTRSTPPTASCCGSSRPVQASKVRRQHSVDGERASRWTGWGADANGAGGTVARLLGEPVPTVQLVGAVYVFAVD